MPCSPTATSGSAAVTAARDRRPDLVVLDVMLPKRDGFDVCRTLRQRGVHTPILMLTARNQVVDRVVEWLENRYEVGRKFGMAKHVLFELNRLCTHGSQLTYLMPTVSHLCVRGKSSRMDTWLDRFGAYKPVKNAPALSLPLRKATGDAAALLTTLSLLGDDIPEPEVGEVAIKVSVPHFEFEGEYVKRL